MENFKIEEAGFGARYRGSMKEAVKYASDRVRGCSPMVRIIPIVIERVPANGGVARYREVSA